MAHRDLPKILLISADTIGERMAGTGIRYWNLARVLGTQQDVTLAAPNRVPLAPPPGVSIVSYADDNSGFDERWKCLDSLIADHQVIVTQQIPFHHIDQDMLESRCIVLDLYAPWILEKLEYARIGIDRDSSDLHKDIWNLRRLLSVGDFFICASDRQRDFWLGALAAAGRLELPHAREDPELRSLIDVVPFGLPQSAPNKTASGPRGRFESIDDDSHLLIWNGGMWDWLDPLTAIRALAVVIERDPRARLVFMGTRSPVNQVADMSVVERARELARNLDLLDSHVIFNDWVPYEERQNWLLEADAVISLHTDTVEARFAYRTRMLDALWCKAPMVATQGDVLADIVEHEGIGVTVKPGDVDGVAQGILDVLDESHRRQFKENLVALTERFTWEQVSLPLLAYCRSPWKLGLMRGKEPMHEYIRDLERTYGDTAQYARRLESVIAEKNRALEDAGAHIQKLERAMTGGAFGLIRLMPAAVRRTQVRPAIRKLLHRTP